MDDRDPVAAQADDRADLEAVARAQVDHDAGGIHVDDEPAGGRWRRGRRGRGGAGGRCRGHLHVRAGRRGVHVIRHLLARTDLAAAGRGAVSRHDLGRRDDRALAADQRGERRRHPVLLDPDELGFAGNVAEARVLDQEPARLGRLQVDRRLRLHGQSRDLAHRVAPGEKHDDEDPPHETAGQHASPTISLSRGGAAGFGRERRAVGGTGFVINLRPGAPMGSVVPRPHWTAAGPPAGRRAGSR